MAFRVWELSQAIEVAAVEGNWALAASLAETRSPLLMTFAPEQSAEALAAIRKIHSSIAAVTQAAGIARDALVASHRQSMERANAASRYQKAARL
ncbi:flagellar protein FliT [Caballeronia sp. RCC_10]|uniref:flagellar protein FliT n=1 Tax=Caballeronia sp. RCC_10 TaxID=3239227 RepID=UPI0035235A7C